MLFWPGERTIPAIDRDEARFAQASRQMAASGDVVDIRFQDEPRYQKPAGIYWLQAACASLLGEDPDNPIWPYRLPSLLGAIGAVLATFALSREISGSRAAWLGSSLLATSLLLNIEARLATVDACLLCCCTIWLGCLHRIWNDRASLQHQVGFWLALGCGILLKGPVMPALCGLTLVTLCALKRDWRWLSRTRPLSGLALVGVMVLPWLIAISLHSHGMFLSVSLGHDMGAKLAGAQESHGGFPGIYLAELPLAFFPGSLLLVGALPKIWHGRRDPDTAFLLAWMVPGWVMFELVPTKLPHYVLPFYPAIAILTARYSSFLDLKTTRRAGLPLTAAVVLNGALFGFVIPRLQEPFIVRTLMHHRSLYAADLRQGRVAFAGFHEPSVVLWFGTDTQLADPGVAASALNDGSTVLAYVTADAEAEFLRSASSPLLVDTVSGFSIARGKPVSIAVYRNKP